jgi:hypothetical protein
MCDALAFMFMYFHFTFLPTVLVLLLMYFLISFCYLRVIPCRSFVNLFCVVNSSIFYCRLSYNTTKELPLSAFVTIN